MGRTTRAQDVARRGIHREVGSRPGAAAAALQAWAKGAAQDGLNGGIKVCVPGITQRVAAVEIGRVGRDLDRSVVTGATYPALRTAR